MILGCSRIKTEFIEHFTLVASIYENIMEKRKLLRKKGVQPPPDFLGTLTWPLFHCFETPIWPP